jgi:glycerol-3-phosphate dehydrogenase
MTLYDLIVIGGGITGAGVARLAARNGLEVALVERGDLMCGASSASSHMLHGGLRYLEHGRFGLVRESLRERAAVARMAPWLAKPRRFLVPVYRGGRFGGLRLRAGLQLYDWLAGGRAFAPHAYVGRRGAVALEPGLLQDGLRGAGLYSDGVMDDARLGIAVARDAAANGATIHTHTEVTGARPGQGGGFTVIARDVIGGGEVVVHGRAIVNATGAWSDVLRARLGTSLRPGSPDPAPILRPSRGVHLLYPALTGAHGLLLTARSDGRVFFVVPFEDHSLVGTTEIETPSPLTADAAEPSVEEVRYLRQELGRFLPGQANAVPLAVIGGVRPLIASGESVGRASREHLVLDEDGVITIAGGKYTTFRVMAADTLEAVFVRIGQRGRKIADSEDALPPEPRDGADLESIVAHAVDVSFARRVEDVVRRRTVWWLAPDRGRAAASRVASLMGERLGWSPERRREELQSYEALLRDEERILTRSREAM